MQWLANCAKHTIQTLFSSVSWSSECSLRSYWAESILSTLCWLWWFCGNGLSSRCWHTCAHIYVMQPVSGWANGEWKRRLDLQSASLSVKAEDGLWGVSCFLRTTFFDWASKVNIQTYLQPSECRLRVKAKINGGRWKEMTKSALVELFSPWKAKVSQVWLPQLWRPTCLLLCIWVDIINYI